MPIDQGIALTGSVNQRGELQRGEGDGRIVSDILALEEDKEEEEPLLQPLMRGGQRMAPSPLLSVLRQYSAEELTPLPEHLRQQHFEPPYPVAIA